MNKYELEDTENNIKDTLINDEINNSKYIKQLINLLSGINTNNIICIDGEWGAGKTFLVKQLIYLIEKCRDNNELDNFPSISSFKYNIANVIDNNVAFYYNAWKNDDHKDPFESLIFNILDKYPTYKDEITNGINGMELLQEVINILTKIVSNKLFGIDYSAEKMDKIKTFEDLAKEINTYEEKKEIFKKLIDKILQNKRMILIIDELDRCNPRYAIKLLEIVKHFYNLKNVTVILVSNNKEFVKVIEHEYGNGFDAYNYLHKIYDFVMTIDSNRSIDYSKKYLGFKNSTFLPHDVFYAMTEKYSFTLRDCNRFRVLYDSAIDYIEYQKGNGFYYTKKEMLLLFSIILPIIYAFKIKDISAYEKCLKNDISSLKDALYYLNNYFEKTGHSGWLYDFVEVKSNDSTIDDVIDNIIHKFEKTYNAEYHNDIFMDAIKVSL